VIIVMVAQLVVRIVWDIWMGFKLVSIWHTSCWYPLAVNGLWFYDSKRIWNLEFWLSLLYFWDSTIIFELLWNPAFSFLDFVINIRACLLISNFANNYIHRTILEMLYEIDKPLCSQHHTFGLVVDWHIHFKSRNLRNFQKKALL
jgi:hypothetical protein